MSPFKPTPVSMQNEASVGKGLIQSEVSLLCYTRPMQVTLTPRAEELPG